MKNILVMGLGRGSGIAEAVLNSSKLNLVGVIDPDQLKQKRFRKICKIEKNKIFADFTTAVRQTDTDILVIATPTRFHRDHVVMGLENGLHVLCEKPVATKNEDLLSMERVAKAKKRQLAVIQNMRYIPQVRKCRDLIDHDILGKVGMIEVNYHRWRPPRGLKHAVLFNHGVHHLDMMRYMMNSGRPSQIQAMEWDFPFLKKEGSGRFLRLTVKMREGWVMAYNASYGETGRETPHCAEFRIIGEKGVLEACGDPDINPQITFFSLGRGKGKDKKKKISVKPKSWRDIDQEIVEGFAKAAARGEKCETDIKDNAKTLHLLFEAVKCL